MDAKLFGAITVLVITSIAIYGWIANIISLVGMLGGEVTAMFIARCVGVLVAPLGAILGFI